MFTTPLEKLKWQSRRWRDIPADERRASLEQARALLDLTDLIGLALRRHRRHTGESQRDLAARRGWSHSQQGRLESRADTLKLQTVLAALAETPYRLALVDLASAESSGLPRLLTAEDFLEGEVMPRVRGRRRRLSGHRTVVATDSGPLWWWYSESTSATAIAPLWTAEGGAARDARSEDGRSDADSEGQFGEHPHADAG